MGNRDHLSGTEGGAEAGGRLAQPDAGGDLVRVGRPRAVLPAGALAARGGGRGGRRVAVTPEFQGGAGRAGDDVAFGGGGQRGLAERGVAPAVARARGQSWGRGASAAALPARQARASCEQEPGDQARHEGEAAAPAQGQTAQWLRPRLGPRGAQAPSHRDSPRLTPLGRAPWWRK